MPKPAINVPQNATAYKATTESCHLHRHKSVVVSWLSDINKRRLLTVQYSSHTCLPSIVIIIHEFCSFCRLCYVNECTCGAYTENNIISGHRSSSSRTALRSVQLPSIVSTARRRRNQTLDTTIAQNYLRVCQVISAMTWCSVCTQAAGRHNAASCCRRHQTRLTFSSLQYVAVKLWRYAHVQPWPCSPIYTSTP